MRRHGFQLVPDFSGTAHSYTGYTLASAIGDCLQGDRKPRRELLVSNALAVGAPWRARIVILARHRKIHSAFGFGFYSHDGLT